MENVIAHRILRRIHKSINGAAQILVDGITRLSARIDQFEKARALSAKRAEAERKARDAARVQRYLDELPDPEDPDPDELTAYPARKSHNSLQSQVSSVRKAG